MAGKQLASFVYVNGDLYGPDDDVPAEVAEQITNPKAWGEEPEKASAPAKKSTAKKAADSPSK